MDALTRLRHVFNWTPVLVCLSASFQLTAQPMVEEAADYQVKAAMVYKFLSYTVWPESAFATEDSPYRIWVLGARRVGEELERIADARRVNERPIRVFQVSSPAGITEPHVIYVGSQAANYLTEVRQLAMDRAVLVVTEQPQGLEAGSTINLRPIEGRIGFEVSLADAERSDLKISSRLLSVAHSVVKQGP